MEKEEEIDYFARFAKEKNEEFCTLLGEFGVKKRTLTEESAEAKDSWQQEYENSESLNKLMKYGEEYNEFIRFYSNNKRVEEYESLIKLQPKELFEKYINQDPLMMGLLSEKLPVYQYDFSSSSYRESSTDEEKTADKMHFFLDDLRIQVEAIRESMKLIATPFSSLEEFKNAVKLLNDEPDEPVKMESAAPVDKYESTGKGL